MKDKIPTIAEQFCIDRIREFPSLYPHSYAVIASTVIGNQGSTYWTNDGVIAQEDQDYDYVNKCWRAYPFVISEEIASKMANNYFGKFINISWSINGPINNIPDNADESWLEEISSFLSHFRKYTPEVVRRIAEVKTFLHYNVWENPHAGLPERYITDYTNFLKRIPSWEARIDAIIYRRQNGKIDPDTYQGMYI